MPTVRLAADDLLLDQHLRIIPQRFAPALAGQSSTRSTNCSPTLEPCRTGLSTSGGFQPIGQGSCAGFQHQRIAPSARRRPGSAAWSAPCRKRSGWPRHRSRCRARRVPPARPAPCRPRHRSRATRETPRPFPAQAANPFARIQFVTSWPSERNAVATAAPERSDTSRSALGPPSITVMFSFGVMHPLILADDFHFRLQFDAAFGFRAALQAARSIPRRPARWRCRRSR